MKKKKNACKPLVFRIFIWINRFQGRIRSFNFPEFWNPIFFCRRYMLLNIWGVKNVFRRKEWKIDVVVVVLVFVFADIFGDEKWLKKKGKKASRRCFCCSFCWLMILMTKMKMRQQKRVTKSLFVFTNEIFVCVYKWNLLLLDVGVDYLSWILLSYRNKSCIGFALSFWSPLILKA